MKDPVNAMRDYKQALKIDNTYSLAYFNAANVYFHTRHFKQVSTMVEIVWYVYIILGICNHFATFQQHLHMESISLSWSNIPELVVPIMISLIEGCC